MTYRKSVTKLFKCIQQNVRIMCRYFEKHTECQHKEYALQILPMLKGHESIGVSPTLPRGAWTANISTLPFTVSSSFCFLSESSKRWEHIEDNYRDGGKASEENYYIWSMQTKYFLTAILIVAWSRIRFLSILNPNMIVYCSTMGILLFYLHFIKLVGKFGWYIIHYHFCLLK